MKQSPSKIILMLACSLFLMGNGAGLMTSDYQEWNGQAGIIQETTLLPISPPPQLQEVYRTYATITAYNPVPEQTDSTPMITASGEQVREGIVACPSWISFGTLIEIDGKIYECQDRTHPKNDGIFDILFWDLEEAQNFGVIRTMIRVVE